jgi:hypothetical protein
MKFGAVRQGLTARVWWICAAEAGASRPSGRSLSDLPPEPERISRIFVASSSLAPVTLARRLNPVVPGIDHRRRTDGACGQLQVPPLEAANCI